MQGKVAADEGQQILKEVVDFFTELKESFQQNNNSFQKDLDEIKAELPVTPLLLSHKLKRKYHCY
ncbi:hypothetical protein [Oceanobacillus profundus]|uniref:hypothetical protein n=1 Tax=Oceanobacillus TaxID=182709 RepID=UPI0026E2B0F1|nr:hypothetical protein [Oceanobacillus profundus]MDO6450450.1 hypothetical protein [Oceanobacillus profundus]